MKTLIHHGQPSVRRGIVGSHVELQLLAEKDGEWSGVYHFPSHGMTPQEFVARVQSVTELHKIKMRRFNGFVALRKREFRVGAETYRILDCSLAERGTDYELSLFVVRVTGPNQFEAQFRMDHRDGLLYPSLDAVPSDTEIEDIVTTRIGVDEAQKEQHANFVASVGALMGAASGSR